MSKDNQNLDEIEDLKWIAKQNDDKNGISKIKKVCCIRIDENWSMKSQITIASLIIFFTIFFLLILLTMSNILQVSQTMQNSQNQLYISSSRKNLENICSKFKRLVSIHFQAVQKDAVNFQKVFLQVSSKTQNTPNKFLDTPYTVQNQTIFQQNNFYSWVCYSAFGNATDNQTINQENQVFISSAQHFNQIHPLIMNQNYTYLTTIQYTGFWTQNQLIYFYPCLQYPPAYKPFLRVWYIEMNTTDTIYRANNTIFMGFHMSQPYSNYLTHNAQISLTKSLLDKNYRYKGATGSGIDIAKFANLFKIQFEQFIALLVNFDGNLFISPYVNSSMDGSNSLGYFFSNQTITGFNQDDWDQVINLAHKKPVTHNCSLIDLDIASDLLCRWNKKEIRNVLIFATRLKVFNYYVVILLDEAQLLKQLYAQKQQIEDKLINISIFIGCLICAVFLLLLAIVLMIISYIFKPLHRISAFCENINQRNIRKIDKKSKKLINIENIVSLGVFKPLTLSFYNLVKQFTGLKTYRNQRCKQVESLQYPKKDFKVFQKEHSSLNNMNLEIDYYSKSWGGAQLHYLDQYQQIQISSSPNSINKFYNEESLTKKYDQYVQQIRAPLENGQKLDTKKLLKLIFEIFKN